MLTECDTKYLDSIFTPFIKEEVELTQGYWQLGKNISFDTNFECIPNKATCILYALYLNERKCNYKFTCKKLFFTGLPDDVEHNIISFIEEPFVSFKTVYRHWEQKYVAILNDWNTEDNFDILYYPINENDYFTAQNRLKKITAMLHRIKMSSIAN